MRKTFFKPKKGKKKIHFGEVTRFEINQKILLKQLNILRRLISFQHTMIEHDMGHPEKLFCGFIIWGCGWFFNLSTT